MNATVIPRVLSIAGTDPTGGAGIQADLKSIGALGGYGMAVVTALVAQNTQGVREVHVPDPSFLRAQLDAVSDDVVIDAVKLGMLHSVPLITVVTEWLTRVQPPIVVLDPVMVATSGDRLLDGDAEQAVRELCIRVDLVTPNIPELAVLTRSAEATDWDVALEQAQRLSLSTGVTVLLKGGHLAGEACPDAIVDGSNVFEVSGRRVESANTHGTGCSLSSAMATLLAAGDTWPAALVRAKEWLVGAVAAGSALDVGRGRGPVDHFHEVRPCANPSVQWWHETQAIRADVDECAFVRGLGDGSLQRADFEWYLAQDALYLGEYSRVLARASSLAPTSEEQAFWAKSAASALEEELALHRVRLGEATTTPAPTTVAYTDHLHAAASRGSYSEIVAALLPCFWLYTDVGVRLSGADHIEHPFHDWLHTYADPLFAEATATAREIVDRTASIADHATRDRMRSAFIASMQHELAFFVAPVRQLHSPHV